VFASAQTIVITNGTQIYASLTNTTVSLSNQCELRVTAATTPISGCLINLASADTSLVLLGIKPSVLVSTYLSQVRISGAVAVADSNCRVVQYGNGAIVLPHAPSFQPLQVFSGPHFTGTSNNLSAYVYYKGSGLGAMNATISSFRLKRGYTWPPSPKATAATAKAAIMSPQMAIWRSAFCPAVFDNKRALRLRRCLALGDQKGNRGQHRIRIEPVQWKYNWNMDQNSTRDLQYVPSARRAGGRASARTGRPWARISCSATTNRIGPIRQTWPWATPSIPGRICSARACASERQRSPTAVGAAGCIRSWIKRTPPGLRVDFVAGPLLLVLQSGS
jgi:hypothetical protein